MRARQRRTRVGPEPGATGVSASAACVVQASRQPDGFTAHLLCSPPRTPSLSSRRHSLQRPSMHQQAILQSPTIPIPLTSQTPATPDAKAILMHEPTSHSQKQKEGNVVQGKRKEKKKRNQPVHVSQLESEPSCLPVTLLRAERTTPAHSFVRRVKYCPRHRSKAKPLSLSSCSTHGTTAPRQQRSGATPSCATHVPVSDELKHATRSSDLPPVRGLVLRCLYSIKPALCSDLQVALLLLILVPLSSVTSSVSPHRRLREQERARGNHRGQIIHTP